MEVSRAYNSVIIACVLYFGIFSFFYILYLIFSYILFYDNLGQGQI